MINRLHASYYRHFIRIPEKLETEIRRHEPWRILEQPIFDRLLLRSPFERACYAFGFKTLVRNDTRALLFGGIAGLGLVLSAISARAQDDAEFSCGRGLF